MSGAIKDVTGVLLAGGLARRMGGGDKCMRKLAGRPLLEHLIDAVQPQVSELILNANGEAERFGKFGLRVVPDIIDGYAGPLAGILTGLQWTKNHVPDAKWMASFATDAPFVPDNLVSQMLESVEANKAELACATSGGRAHPVFGLWSIALLDQLHSAMINEDIRKIDSWTSRYKLSEVSFEVEKGIDPFFNVNKPENLEEAEHFLSVKDRLIG
ncbi:MAG: molybdenum cofactor guanylyltransferase MobA [Rhodospirillaceae bacterium TMED8]|nr:molybdenum cofactor guanylyltransferase MobA [Magnetovibrio sp.]OUT50074.1 MAG: molybdenum cofactor guanylyltransferase MobA [Rhodospirillaceae bacterium TMED8]|tara:strand:- start:2120 stop:2761 length:642 start_codon:yes stop_codon:yes gene_type:complete